MSDSLDISALSGVMAKVILVLQRNRQGLTMPEILRLTGVRDIKYLRKTFNELEGMPGLVLIQHEIRKDRCAVWTLRDAEEPLVKGEKFTPEAGKNSIGGEKVTPEARREKLLMGEKVTPETGKNSIRGEKFTPEESLKDSRLKDSRHEDLSLKVSLFQDSDRMVMTEAGPAEKQAWLEQADLLFGKPVAWQPAFARKPGAEILGWLAQAHQAWVDKKLDRPWGLVFRGLRGELRQKLPDARFLNNPLAHLPADYLRACGLLPESARDDPAAPEPADDDGADLPDEDELPPDELLEDELMRDDPALLSPEQARLAQTWELLLGQLERQMPRGAFGAWLQDTRALDWDPAQGQVRVLARDPDAVEWLENRMGSTVARMLSGMLDCPVQVQFVCPPPGTESAAQMEIRQDVRKDEFGLPLSPAMQRALRGLVLGKTRAVVAWEMGISPNTLKVYLWKAFRRLGANNAADAAVRALEWGIDLRQAGGTGI